MRLPLWTKVRDGERDFTQTETGKRFAADMLVALAPAKAKLVYVLACSIGATRIFEAGTSCGVSTICLAAAVRDNLKAKGDADGIVIGTEHGPEKVTVANENLTEAGVADYVEIREGDLRESLKDLDGPIDFMLVDIRSRCSVANCSLRFSSPSKSMRASVRAL